MSLSPRHVRDVARRWWSRTISDDRRPAVDARTRALLRRTHSTAEAMTLPAAIALARDLNRDGVSINTRDLENAVDLSRVLAHVRRDSKIHPMRKVGWPSFPTGASDAALPAMSELRFRRLLQTGDGPPRVSAFTRLVAQLGDEANVAALAEAFWFWNHPDAHVKQQWAFHYFNAANAAPPSLTDDVSTPEENEDQ